MLRALCNLAMPLALLALAGCAGQQAYQAGEPLRLHDAKYENAVRAAEDVLNEMHFPIEKADAGQGIVTSAPLRGGQFFELWRRDNVGLANTLESNLHAVRRCVEVQVGQDGGLVWVDCTVRVERLSIPENEVASISQAYQMYSRSTQTTQRLALTPQQRAAMAWIDLGRDGRLEAKILQRVERKLERLH